MHPGLCFKQDNMARSKFLCVAVLALSSSPLALLAQTTATGTDRPAANAEHLGEIVLDAASAPAAAGTGPVAHLDADDIARSQGTALQDVLSDVPSVATSRRGNLLSNGITIRGFGGDHHYPGDPATKIVVDGVADTPGRHYQNASGAISDPALLRSVDVTTGPLASLEYGSGITGGAVSARTINGSDLTGGEDGFRFRQMLGANSNGDGWLTSSTLAWQTGQWVDFLVNYTRRGQDTQEDGEGRDLAVRGFNVPSLLFKSRLRIDESNSITLSYNRFESAERNVPYSSTIGLGTLGLVDRDRKGAVTSLSWNYDPAGNDLVDLELTFSRSDQDHNVVALTPGFAASSAGLFNITTDRLTLTNTARFDTGAVSHSLRAGLGWSSEERERLEATVGRGKDRRVSLFAIDTMDFGNGVRASLGLRLEDQKISATKGAVSFGPYDNTARTLGAGLEKGFANGLTVFGSFTYTEGLPNYDLMAATYNGRLQQSRNWEAGVRYEGNDILAAGDRLSGAITAYRSEIWNTIYSLTATGNALQMEGFEISADYRMESGTYLHATVNLTDNEQRLASGAWATYSYSTGDTLSLALGHQFASGLDLSWRMEAQKGILIGTADHAGFGVHDFKASYTAQEGFLEGVTVDFGIENVFDKTYHHAVTPLVAATGVPYVFEPGRNFRLNLSKTF